MLKPSFLCFAFFLASTSFGALSTAHAQTTESSSSVRANGMIDHDIDTPFLASRPVQLDAHVGFTWWGLGVAGGARLGIPLVQNGFIGSLDNSFYLHLGVDVYGIDDTDAVGTNYGVALGFPVAAHWEFYFTPQWSAFAELGVNVFVPTSVFQRNVYAFDGAWFLGQVGGSLRLNSNVALTARIGNPYASFGLTMEF